MPAKDPTAAERQRRYRARLKQGRFVVSVELTEKCVDMLVVREWLDEIYAGDPQACGAAVGSLLDALANRISLRVTSAAREVD